MDTVGDRFKWGIDQVGKGNISAAAKRLGVSRATLYAWMRGEIGNMRAHNLARLCELTKKSKNWYLHGRHEEDSSAANEAATTLLAMPMVAQRLAVAIKNSGIGIDELAAVCDVSAKTVYRWLATGRIAQAYFAKIEVATAVPEGWLNGAGDLTAVVPFPGSESASASNKGLMAIGLTQLDLPTLQALARMPAADRNDVLSAAINGYEILQNLRTLILEEFEDT